MVEDAAQAVVTTWTLCTIANAGRELHEMGRVLRGDGRLIFVVHGRAPDPRVAHWQDRLTTVRRRVAGGCHLNRPIDQLIEASGFEIPEIERGYVKGPRVGAYLHRGVARLRASGQ
jgi:SAM-dependent methyltransferase